MKVIPKRNFLVRQDAVEGGKKIDVIAIKGQPIDLTEKEAISFWGGLDLKDADKKKLLGIAKNQRYSRVI